MRLLLLRNQCSLIVVMSSDSTYKDYILYDVLGHITDITARAMFGGWGIYKSGSIVGIIVDGELFLKSNQNQKVLLEQQGCYPFVYTSKGKKVTMLYMSVPEEILENPDAIESRIDASYAISQDAKK